MTARCRAIVAAALLLAPSCGLAVRDGEIACQRRLLARSGHGGGRDLAASFAAMSRRFEQMPLDGCSDDQRARARIMARVARDLAGVAARVGDPLRRAEQGPELRNNQAFLELMAGIEQLERRRQAMREDLDRMIAAQR